MYQARSAASTSSTVTPRLGRRPQLSVVVPAYNVEHYLAECLQSILGQKYGPLEIVVIDDGSTDGTAKVARGFADAYETVRVVATPNRGLGAARNRGVLESSGELIAFADSDDVVTPWAYDRLVGALERSGSDFVVGSMRRFDEAGYDEPGWMRRLHARDRLGLTVDDWPEILGDVFAWNKVFRRAFWERERLAFPEGVRYEDQVTLTHAYLVADAFDVIAPVVYDWRIRGDGSSITDGRRDIADLRDRVRTKRTALQTVRGLGSERVYETFRDRVLPGDMWRYFAHVPGCGDEYWAVLSAAVREFWRGGGLVRSPLTAPYRLAGWLAGQDRRLEAETVVAYANEHALSTVIANDEVLAALPYWDDPEAGIPLDLYRLRADELGWEATLTAVLFEGESLVVRGSARLAVAEHDDAVARVVLTAGDGSRLLGARTSTQAVEARFDLRELLAGWPLDVRDAPRVWRADVLWESPGLRHAGPFTEVGASGAQAVPLASVWLDGTYVDVAAGGSGVRIVAHPLGRGADQRTA